MCVQLSALLAPNQDIAFVLAAGYVAASKLYPCSVYFVSNIVLETALNSFSGLLFSLIVYYNLGKPRPPSRPPSRPRLVRSRSTCRRILMPPPFLPPSPPSSLPSADYIAFTQPANVPLNFVIYLSGLVLQVGREREGDGEER